MNKEEYIEIINKTSNLDPTNWSDFEEQSKSALGDILDYLRTINQKKSWNEIPEDVKNSFDTPLPSSPKKFETVYREFTNKVLPYPTGNIHPRFWAWADGTGTPLAMISEMLASGMNPNVCAGEHSSMYIEKQVLDWMKTIMGFPKDSSGIFVSGGAMSNLTALIIARNSFTEQKTRKCGLKNYNKDLIIYTSREAHSCIDKAADIMGLGTDSVRKVPVDENYKIDLDILNSYIQEDKRNGAIPFCIVGTVGTVNTGAIDPLDALSSICKKEKMWLHIDGAYGAAAKITPEYEDQLKSIEKADSLTFDLHKWFFMPFGIGCLLVKDKGLHKRSFEMKVDYLFNHERGLASGPEMYADYGIEMSRNFKSLPLWFTLKIQGIDKIASIVRQNIAFAFYMKDLINENKQLELIAPVTLNVVCFRYNSHLLSENKLNDFNKELLMRIQESGQATPSYTILKGKYAIRVAIINHRTEKSDIETFIESCILLGDNLIKEMSL